MKRSPSIHYCATPPEAGEMVTSVICGAKSFEGATSALEHVTCRNCQRRMPKPPELVPFTAAFVENPNIDACPECLPAVAAILEANPDTEPSELELPHCDFCDDLRLVYVQRAAEKSP
jgi:hypothetical protein